MKDWWYCPKLWRKKLDLLMIDLKDSKGLFWTYWIQPGEGLSATSTKHHENCGTDSQDQLSQTSRGEKLEVGCS